MVSLSAKQHIFWYILVRSSIVVLVSLPMSIHGHFRMETQPSLIGCRMIMLVIADLLLTMRLITVSEYLETWSKDPQLFREHYVTGKFGFMYWMVTGITHINSTKYQKAAYLSMHIHAYPL